MESNTTNDRALRLLGCLFADTSILCDAQDASKAPAKMAEMGWDEETVRTILYAHKEFTKLISEE